MKHHYDVTSGLCADYDDDPAWRYLEAGFRQENDQGDGQRAVAESPKRFHRPESPLLGYRPCRQQGFCRLQQKEQQYA